MRKPSLSPEAILERRERVARMTRAGTSAREIAAIVGITDRSVIRIRSEMGIAKPAAVPMTEAEVAEAKRLLEDGCSVADVARTLGRTAHTINRRLPGYGWPPGEGARLALMTRWADYRMNAVFA